MLIKIMVIRTNGIANGTAPVARPAVTGVARREASTRPRSPLTLPMKVLKQETPKKFPAINTMVMMISLSVMIVYQLARVVILMKIDGEMNFKIGS